MKKVRILFAVLIITIIMYVPSVDAEAVCKVTKGTGTNIGDEITCGTESFYVISNDGTNIEMLAKYNLEIGSNFTDVSNSSGGHSSKATKIENPSNIQNSECTGKAGTFNDVYYSVSTCTINLILSDNESLQQEQQKYYDTYKEYLINNLGLSNSITVEGMTINKLVSLGCTYDSSGIKNGYYIGAGSCTTSNKK